MEITELPKDLLEEILCRVPATSLKRSRSTCKLWNRLFNDKSKRFARKHSDKAAKEFLVLLLTNEFSICPISVNLHHGITPSVEFKEKYGVVPLPCEKPYRYGTANVSVVREEKLSVLLQQGITTKTEIWVTNKIDDETKMVVSWSKVLALDLSTELQISDFGTFLLDEEKKVFLCCQRWYNVEEEETEVIEKIYIVGEDSKVTQEDFGVTLNTMAESLPTILNYLPSLVQIQRPGGKRKRGE